jgi:hypothetical protein
MRALPTASTFSEIPGGGAGVIAQRTGDHVVVAVASASSCGFDTEYAKIADPYLERVVTWLDTDRDGAHLADRTRSYLCELRERSPGDYDPGCPYLEVVAAIADRTSVWIAWVGGGLAQLVRGGRVVASTTPHWIGLESSVPRDLAMIASRVATCDSVEIDSLRWHAEPGDELVLLEHRLLIGADWSPPPSTWPGTPSASTVAARARDAERLFRGVVHRAGPCAVLRW